MLKASCCGFSWVSVTLSTSLPLLPRITTYQHTGCVATGFCAAQGKCFSTTAMVMPTVPPSLASGSPVYVLEFVRVFAFPLSDIPVSGDHLITPLSAQLDPIPQSVHIKGNFFCLLELVAICLCLTCTLCQCHPSCLRSDCLFDCPAVHKCWMTNILSEKAFDSTCPLGVSAFKPWFLWTVTGN